MASEFIELPDVLESVPQVELSDRDRFPTISDSIPYGEFFRRFIAPNHLCVIEAWPIDTIGKWPARHDWVSQDGDSPNLKFLIDNLVPADHQVPVSRCDERYFNSQKCIDMPFGEYVDYFHSGESNRNEKLYLKDWHFRKEFPVYEAYRTPAYFCSDWLNEFLESEGGGSDYRFVYVGPKGSWTPFHSDVFGSYSWSANIVGRKKWIFYPPGAEAHLKDASGNLVYDVNDVWKCDWREERGEKYPNAHKLKRNYEVIQEPGDVIFVPSGWHHQVHNLEDTISINHNWFNGANIGNIFGDLKKALEAVEHEISDCKEGSSDQEWEDECQKLLHANHGMNMVVFLQLLEFIGERRRRALADGTVISFDGKELGPKHVEYDLMKVKETVNKVKQSLPKSSQLLARCEDIQEKLQ